MGQRVLRFTQYGLEGDTHGTAVEADTRLAANVVLPESDREVVMPSAGVGQRVTNIIDNAYVRRILAEGITLETPAESGLYYQILPLLFSLGITGNVSPTEQTASEGDYLWEFDANLSSAEDVDSMTLEFGDSTDADQGYEVAYCMASSIEISGNADTGEVTSNVTLFGDEIAVTQMTSGLSYPSITGISGGLARLYVDDTWAGIGSSEISNALLDWTLTIDTGVHPKLRGNANQKIADHGHDETSISLNLGLERGATNLDTEEDYYRSSTVTARFVRLEIDSGIAIGSGNNHKLTVDIAGTWTSWQSLGRDQDGNSIEVAMLSGGYDTTGSAAFGIDVTTDVSAI